MHYATETSYFTTGVTVMLASRSPKLVDGAVQLIHAEGGQVSGVVEDVSNLKEGQRLAEHAISRFSRLDIWVNNTGSSGVSLRGIFIEARHTLLHKPAPDMHNHIKTITPYQGRGFARY